MSTTLLFKIAKQNIGKKTKNKDEIKSDLIIMQVESHLQKLCIMDNSVVPTIKHQG